MIGPYDLFINQLAGSAWLGIIVYGILLAVMCVMGRTGLWLMSAILGMYFVVMAILFGGLTLFVLLALGGSVLFAINLMKIWD